tara:strand:- start:816 stop:1088 length:273 start_codon:yes stop_codon:yes gene_type:complete
MTKTTDNYSAFAGVNLSNARSENETYEDYKKRIKENKDILKLYNTVGRDRFREMFPAGVHEALENSAEEIYNEVQQDFGTEDKVVHNSSK